ncbi:MAG: alpha/beta hydrolase [Spirochaetes bacterium]|nr:alpha/beta hydrolase [Spirochaetota bacterium]
MPVITALLVVIVVSIFMVRSWTLTPYGRLDPRAAILLKYVEIRKIDLFEKGRSIGQVREFSKHGGGLVMSGPAGVRKVENTEIPGPAGKIPVRIYVPEGEPPFPVVLFFHGGGYVIGDLDTHDNICRKLSRKTPAVVVSVQYRLAPEHAFPAALDDALASLQWVLGSAGPMRRDPERIAVAGDSAGANLSAALSHMARDRGLKLAAQVLIYPGLDLSSLETGSHVSFAKGYYLTRRYIEKFREYYVPDRSKWTDPRVSPLLATNFRDLPPALVVTAGFDPFRDDGAAYAEKLKGAGVPVLLSNYPGMIHGFISMDRLLPDADSAVDECASFLGSKMR